MGKSTEYNIAAEKAFSKLELLLTQTANDAANCLKVLKGNLSEYDNRHGLHFVNTSKSFMRSDIRAAKDTASELRLAANQIAKSKAPAESEIAAARSKMNATADAMNALKKTGRAYDEKNGKSKGITTMIDNVLVGKDDKKKESKGGLFNNNSSSNSSGKDKENDSKGGLFGFGENKKESGGGWLDMNGDGNNSKQDGTGVLSAADTVEVVVKSTLRDSFSGFSALKHQISVAEKSFSPSFADRAKEAMVGITNKLRSDSTSSPPNKDKKSMSM